MRVGGSKKIAQMLVRAGRKISRETVRRYRKKPPALVPAPKRGAETPGGQVPRRSRERTQSRLDDRHHQRPQLSGNLDLQARRHSRRIFSFSSGIQSLLERADEQRGRRSRPDRRGPIRKAQTLRHRPRSAIQRATVRRGAPRAQSGAAIRSDLPVRLDRHHRAVVANSQRNARPALSATTLLPPPRYYATLRPHQGFGGATPAEIYFGLASAHLNAVSPPRASSCDPAQRMDLPLDLVYAHRERRLPFLIRRKLAA